MKKDRKRDDLIDLFRMMVRIRICEEGLVNPIVSGEVKCPVHLYSGEEAVAAGVCSALTTRDYVFGTHRSHGHYLAKGGAMREMVAEIFCRETGCAKGRGGSMHVVAPDVGFLGAAPIVAGTISLAVGAGLAIAVKGDDRIAVAFFGDGAAGEGVLYEALNFAALRSLPVVFVCENNLYSTHLPISECRVKPHIAEIAKPLGVDALIVDGNDIFAVQDAAYRLTRRCRAGKGPGFLECKTYRFRGHVGPDDNIQGSHTDIRPTEEIKSWKERDPIILFRKILVKEYGIGETVLKKIVRDAEKEVEEAFAFARASQFPTRESLKDYVYE